MMDGIGMGWGIAMMVAVLLLAVVVVGAVVWVGARLVRERECSHSADRAPVGALEVLERRFAAGEIDADEYRERRSTLDGGG